MIKLVSISNKVLLRYRFVVVLQIVVRATNNLTSNCAALLPPQVIEINIPTIR